MERIVIICMRVVMLLYMQRCHVSRKSAAVNLWMFNQQIHLRACSGTHSSSAI